MLHRIEITGFDRSIQIAQLAQVIQTAAPLEVELGIVMQHSKLRLHPPKQEGRFRPRNPDWDQILEAEAAGLRLACHASGSRILKALLRGRLPDLRHPAGLRPFKTLQLNTTTRAQPFEGHIGSKRSMYTSYVHFIEDLIAHDELRIEEVLAQLQPTTEVVVQVIVSHKVQPIIPAALLTLAHRCQNAGMTTRLLLDTSGGRGKAALECWPSRTALGPESADLPIGFAGGLTPDNIPQALSQLTHLLAPGETVWLGLESGVRRTIPDPNRPGKSLSMFDLDAVRAVLNACKSDSQTNVTC